MTKSDNELMRLYKDAPLRYKLYTIIRNSICPLYEIERYVPDAGTILDFGCGHGIFANILAIRSGKRHIIGMDIMEDKIKVANSTLLGRSNIEFLVGDVQKDFCNKHVDCITFIDILCYVPFDKKKELLKSFYNYLRPGGKLVIKTIKEKPLLKYWWTLFHMATIDKIMHRSFEKNSYFLEEKDYIGMLKDIGFKVEFKDINKRYPYSHCLYICSKG